MRDRVGKGENPSIRKEIDSKYNRIKGELKTYVRSFNKITLRDSSSSITFETDHSTKLQSDTVLKKMDCIWVLAYDVMVFGLGLREKGVPELIGKIRNSADEKKKEVDNKQREIEKMNSEISGLQSIVNENTRISNEKESLATEKREKVAATFIFVIPAIVFLCDASDATDSARAARRRAERASNEIMQVLSGQNKLRDESAKLSNEADELNKDAEEIKGLEEKLEALADATLKKADSLAKNATHMSSEDLKSKSEAERCNLRKEMDDFVAYLESNPCFSDYLLL